MCLGPGQDKQRRRLWERRGSEREGGRKGKRRGGKGKVWGKNGVTRGRGNIEKGGEW